MIELRCSSSSGWLAGRDRLERQFGPLGGQPAQEVQVLLAVVLAARGLVPRLGVGWLSRSD